MSKITKTIAALGVVAGLGVAALPLASYAAPGSDNPETITVNASVQSTISMSVDDDTVALSPIGGGDISTDTINVSVSTNALSGYTLAAATSDPGALVSGSYSIPAGEPTAQGEESAWGIKGGKQATYVGLSTTPTTLQDKAGVANSDKTEITVGVNAAADQETGSYQGTFTLTATAKN